MTPRMVGAAGCAAVLCVLAGCGGSSTDSAGPQAAATIDASKFPPPTTVVQTFLEAVRTGDHETAGAMLTDLARQKTQEADLQVAPPGSDTARFVVGQTEMVDPEIAHVASSWTDLEESGQPHTSDVIWALRLEPQGWRIAGMVTKVFEDQPPLLLDFENPEDMIRKQELAEQELERRMMAAQGAGTAPTGTAPAAVPPAGPGQPAVQQAAQPGQPPF